MSILITDPKIFFNQWLEETLAQRKQNLNPLLREYLVGLLSQYIIADNLFIQKENKKEQPTLVFLLKEALEEENSSLKIKKYQKLGDTSLFMAGFFPNFFARKIIDIDYYISMGENAYETISYNIQNKESQVLYKNLSLEFKNVVDILGQMNDLKDDNILRTYELWILTRSPRLEKKLQSLGVNVIEIKKQWQ